MYWSPCENIGEINLKLAEACCGDVDVTVHVMLRLGSFHPGRVVVAAI
jgi:hypothetical protein